ncbi:unnamed protein product [Zymoseptoria tritici ST99CH_3D1]|nr:unnamed protein product [Zymoseptoria tritici ST99CH_3D1]
MSIRDGVPHHEQRRLSHPTINFFSIINSSQQHKRRSPSEHPLLVSKLFTTTHTQSNDKHDYQPTTTMKFITLLTVVTGLVASAFAAQCTIGDDTTCDGPCSARGHNHGYCNAHAECECWDVGHPRVKARVYTVPEN